MKNKYFSAVIEQQNSSWKLMYTNAVYDMLEKFQHDIRGRATAHKCARAFTICYNLIFSGNYDVALEDICIPDASDCVEEYFAYRGLSVSEKELAVTTHMLYDSLFPDGNTSIEEIKEYI